MLSLPTCDSHFKNRKQEHKNVHMYAKVRIIQGQKQLGFFFLNDTQTIIY